MAMQTVAEKGFLYTGAAEKSITPARGHIKRKHLPHGEKIPYHI
jgi:hypothetical protein